MPLCQQIVQANHAAYEVGTFGSTEDETKSLVLCEVKNEQELLKAHEWIKSRGIDLVLFREPDIGNEATAMATLPLSNKQRRLMSRFPLWKE